MAAFATLARNSGLTLFGIRSALRGILTFAKAPERWRTQDAARVLPKFDLEAGACFPPRRRPAKRTAMGARIVGFILYLALSYGVIKSVLTDPIFHSSVGMARIAGFMAESSFRIVLLLHILCGG